MSEETMKAIRIHQFGGPEVLVYEDAPRPQIGEDEVLIRVHAAALNPVDWKAREGYLQGFIDYSLPFIPGRDVSGVVEAVGMGVTDFYTGDAVYALVSITRDGTYAEYVAVKASDVALKPQSLDHVEAAAVPLAALTAWQALFDTAHLSTGQTVLIHAAAGGVGTFAVQLAHWKGARVIGTASASNHDFVRGLGADEVIDYNAVRIEDAVRDVDVVFDTMGGETQERSWGVLRPGGVLVSVVGRPSEERAAAHGARAAYHFVQPNATQLTEIGGLLDLGKIEPVIEAVLPLSEARQAQEVSQEGHVRGKLVLAVV